jgi:type IV pilus assembly protein PilQ
MRKSFLVIISLFIFILLIQTPFYGNKDNMSQNKAANILTLKKQIGIKKKVSFNFSNLTMDIFLQTFSDEYDLDIINNTNISKEISLSLKDLHPIDVFDTLVQSWDCEWYLKNNVIRVVKQMPIRVFELNYVKASNILDTIMKVCSVKEISLLEENNAIIAKSSFKNLNQIEQIINELDKIPTQVLIEAKILETNVDLARNLGVNMNHPYTNITGGNNAQTKGFATAAADGKDGLFIRVIRNKFQLSLEALINNGKTNILAHPKLLVKNHKTAKIITGHRLGYSTLTNTIRETIQSVQFLETGVKLSFTPHVSEDGEITLDIIPEVSEGHIEDNLPMESTTRTETQVIVKDGQTVIIGGLIQTKRTDADYGVPILSDIPLINFFFQRKSVDDSKREILILITPHIVKINEDSSIISPNISTFLLDTSDDQEKAKQK